MVAFEAGTRVHFVGIGGVSMSALAELLAHRGCLISGSDRQASPLTQRLERLGIPIQIGHSASVIDAADCVVYTSATDSENPERKAAQKKGIPLLRRAELLGQLTASHPTICVAGTHGKTTTTAMITIVLIAAGQDPTALVGGVVRELETTLRTGQGSHWVVEADEYDRTFLSLKPTVAVVTTLEADHLDCYRDIDDIRSAFEQFINTVPQNGCAVLCADAPEIQTLNLDNKFEHITYGLSNGRLRAKQIEQNGFGSAFDVVENNNKLGRLRLQVPGRHNITNALAAVGVANHLGLDWTDVCDGIEAFRGVHRRFEVLGEVEGITVVDDYAHHPTEIRATLDAARAGWSGRIVAVFQPHLYTRTRDFAPEFARALQKADRVWITDIYPAREEPIPGIDGNTIAIQIPDANYAPTLDDLQKALIRDVQPGDLLLIMGAGDIEHTARKIYQALGET
jgi:UDP-N-acetylmuramate--alanine ligase